MTARKVRYFLFLMRKIGIFVYSWEVAYFMSWNEVRHCIAVSWINTWGVLLWGMGKHIHSFNAQPLRLYFKWSWKMVTFICAVSGHIWYLSLKVENVASWEGCLYQHSSRATCPLCRIVHGDHVSAFSSSSLNSQQCSHNIDQYHMTQSAHEFCFYRGTCMCTW